MDRDISHFYVENESFLVWIFCEWLFVDMFYNRNTLNKHEVNLKACQEFVVTERRFSNISQENESRSKNARKILRKNSKFYAIIHHTYPTHPLI